ncbi:uncharacterized protein LOC128549139 isoform X2 [Mercenaria mercenaria]|uniref:uncharacterized protein LOC128549139 isoform X2 n=1 Tax=Mercenaria mercenaria TaxID=6596 RepID=UPI00234F5588|nr:uncharacterized protein LOC128549139 isoform X2 [Mercenaria mercenaria]
MVNILGLVGVGVSGLALLFAILATSLAYWETAKFNTVSADGGVIDVHVGIWKSCAETDGNKVCYDIDTDRVIIHAESLLGYNTVRTTIILGIIFTASAIVPAILVMFVLQTKKVLYSVAAGLNVAAGLFLMIAMAVFALDIIAWLSAWVGGGLFVGAKLTEKQ